MRKSIIATILFSFIVFYGFKLANSGFKHPVVLDASTVGVESSVEAQVQVQPESLLAVERVYRYPAFSSVSVWHVAFQLLKSGDAFQANIEDIRVEFLDDLDGTYVRIQSFRASKNPESDLKYGDGVTLYVRTKEQKDNWDKYLNEQKSLKRKVESPRDVQPPE